MCRMLAYEMPTDYNSINVSDRFDLDTEHSYSQTKQVRLPEIA